MNFNKIKGGSWALLSLLLLAFQPSFAADLVVIDNGPAGTYGSIAAAITAANNGDRIIVTNKASGTAWVEDLIVNKSLTFVSATDNVRFKLQGNITINAANNREVTIIGLECLSGFVQGINNTATSKTVVNLLGSSFNFAGAAINFDYANYDLTVANCDLGTGSDIRFQYGKILGNQARTIRKLSASSSSNDKSLIIGNQATNIAINSPNTFVEVSNNFLTGNRTIANSVIFINDLKTGNHIFANNTLDMAGAVYGISFDQSNVGGIATVLNNVITQTVSVSNDYGYYLYANSGTVITEYNYISSNTFLASNNGLPLSSTDQYNSSISIATDGRNNTGSPAIDGANPSIQYYDLNLTRGDAGAYGGSFTLDNYFPLTTGSSRVYHIEMDRGIFQGYNLNVKALGFDR